MEQWRTIEKYGKIFLISNEGRIKSTEQVVLFGTSTTRTCKSKLLTPTDNGNGYMIITVSNKNRKRHNCYIHRLVAEAFIPNPDNLPQVNHKDENVSNNCVDNLEWCDAKYNNNYGHHNDNKKKPIVQYSKDGKKVKEWVSIVEAEKFYDLQHIWDCCNGKRKTCGGYVWKYKLSPQEVIAQLDALFDETITDEEYENK